MNLKSPTAEDIACLRSPRLAAIALKLSGAYAAMAAACVPGTCLAIAQARHPGDSPDEAMQKMLDKVQADTLALTEYGAARRALYDLEQRRLRPLMGAAARRLYDLKQTIEHLDKQMQCAELRRSEKVENLNDQHLAPQEIDRILPPEEHAENIRAIQAESAAAKKEAELLDRFVATHDESILPAEFIESVLGSTCRTEQTPSTEASPEAA